MSLRSSVSVHFTNPKFLIPMTGQASNISQYNPAGTSNAATTTAFFTGVSKFGVQDTTNWSANTYKTIYSHTGYGFISGMIGCTSGGSDTTTFEITIDGASPVTIAISVASSYRAILLIAGLMQDADFTTSAQFAKQNSDGLDSGTLTTDQNGVGNIMVPRAYQNLGVPHLYYSQSCLIRMKHSSAVTNSTATAYSGVWVRKGI